MFLSESQYRSVLDSVPICCVDIIIQYDGKILLIHRKESEDMGDLWWIPGGRIHKNETFENAVKRKALVETGLCVNIIKKGQSYEGFYESKKSSSGIHFITTVFVTNLEKLGNIKLDYTTDDYKWIDYSKDRNTLHALLATMIEENIHGI